MSAPLLWEELFVLPAEEQARILAADADPFEECECEHDHDEHAQVDDETFCQHVMESGARCSCPSFVKATP